MRPVHLAFAGLRSYRAQAAIDFTDLDLFAVIGDTGAGKSTIIEALSLALYAKKTWQGGGSHLDDMIADGERTMRVELTFAAAEHEWTVTRSRHRTTTPGVNKLVCRTGAERVDGAAAVNERIIELIGLDHGQFTRAVVMPQGRFDELLRATPSMRGKLLGSILGLDDVRRVGAAAAGLAGRFRETVVAARIRRGDLPDDPAAALVAAEGERTRAVERLAALQGAIGRSEAASVEAAALRAALDRVEAAQVAVPPDDGADQVATLRAALTAGTRLRDERQAATGVVADADDALHALDAATAAALDGFASRDAAVAAAVSLRRTATDLAEVTSELDAALAGLAALDADPPTTDVPAAVVAARDVARAGRDEAQRAQDAAATALATARAAWVVLTGSRDRAREAAATVADAAARSGAAAATVESTAAVAAQATTEAEAAEHAHRDASAAAAAATASRRCRPGDSCPVCERPLPGGFTPPASPDLDATEATLRSVTAQAAASRHASSTAVAVLEQARHVLASAESAAGEARAAVDHAVVEAVAAGVEAGADSVEAAISGPAAALHAAEAILIAADGDYRQAHDDVTGALAVVAAAGAAHDRERTAAFARVAALERRTATLRATAADVPPAWRTDGDPTPDRVRAAADRVRVLLDDLAVLDGRCAEASAVRVAACEIVARVDVDAAAQVTQPAQQAVTALDARLGRIADLAAAMAAAAATTDVEVPPAPPTLPAEVGTTGLPATIDAAVTALEAARRVEAAAAAAATTLAARHQKLTATLTAVLAGVGLADIGAVRHAAGVAHAAVDAADARLVGAKVAVNEAAALDRVLAVGRPFIANLDVLAVAVRDQHFVGHLIKARESDLLAEATRRLRAITGGRFGFVTDFGVVSIASGEVRTPDTLSGGERFQAALALALALVEIASRGGGRLDAVFVDEGFGSLDTAALDTALETLATVAGGGKMVALISHLRPVADYVETVLHVTKDDVLGSRITRLDPDARDRLLADDIRSGLMA